MSCSKTILVPFAAVLLTASFAAAETIEQDPRLIAVAQRFQSGQGIIVQPAPVGDAVVARIYNVTPLQAEHLDNAVQILTWVEEELKRYPAGFVQKHGPKHLMLANAFHSKSAKATAPLYSPTFIADKNSGSILVTVPATLTPTTEALGRGQLHYTLFSLLLPDVKSTDSPLSMEHWKILLSDDAAGETESAKRLTKASNSRESLYKMMWEPFEFGELTTLAKTDARLQQRMDLVQSFIHSLDPQFDATFWAALAVIPEHQRTLCLNDLTDVHSTDQIKADTEIQSDIRALERQWGFKVLWEPGSPAPPMPAKVRLEYSYFTDKKLREFKLYIRMLRENLALYPVQITQRLNVQHLYLLDTFTFRGAGVAGQGMNWLPRPSFAYGMRTLDPAKIASLDFFRRTIHHEVLHLIDKEFSKEGGPIYGTRWDSLNQEGFHYKIGSPGGAASPSQLRFYKDNAKWQGFAEPYGMNIATDDRATLYARLMTAHVADEGRGDQPFLARLKTDTILKAKADRLIEFFQMLKSDLAIPSESSLDSKLQVSLH
ncbi:MAG: hypothetical protein K9N47_24180 [Prosthecobacter sp.]|uniref:hypothetical protein n=1 Tax=Prosthecobacter sp. TaxID=1965333 RepID=UPI00261E9874|nr:hypothetical protein [Prosthecobacter sp.]MCF7789242.1 hypothetical protein [Prosthecobacter sp.]